MRARCILGVRWLKAPQTPSFIKTLHLVGDTSTPQFWPCQNIHYCYSRPTRWGEGKCPCCQGFVARHILAILATLMQMMFQYQGRFLHWLKVMPSGWHTSHKQRLKHPFLSNRQWTCLVYLPCLILVYFYTDKDHRRVFLHPFLLCELVHLHLLLCSFMYFHTDDVLCKEKRSQ